MHHVDLENTSMASLDRLAPHPLLAGCGEPGHRPSPANTQTSDHRTCEYRAARNHIERSESIDGRDCHFRVNLCQPLQRVSTHSQRAGGTFNCRVELLRHGPFHQLPHHIPSNSTPHCAGFDSAVSLPILMMFTTHANLSLIWKNKSNPL